MSGRGDPMSHLPVLGAHASGLTAVPVSVAGATPSTTSSTVGLPQKSPRAAATTSRLTPDDPLYTPPDGVLVDCAADMMAKIYNLLKRAQESGRKAQTLLVALAALAGSDGVAIGHGCGKGFTVNPSEAASSGPLASLGAPSSASESASCPSTINPGGVV